MSLTRCENCGELDTAVMRLEDPDVLGVKMGPTFRRLVGHVAGLALCERCWERYVRPAANEARSLYLSTGRWM